MTQAEKVREIREFYKAKGICYYCGREKAAPGRTHCLNCLDKISINGYKYRATWSEDKKKYYRGKAKAAQYRLYHERKEKGLCVDCGKKALENRVRCLNCLLYNKRRVKKNSEKNGVMPRILFGDGEHCACCGKPVRAEGEKCCERCYDRIVKASAISRAAMDNSNHYWRKDFYNIIDKRE